MSLDLHSLGSLRPKRQRTNQVVNSNVEFVLREICEFIKNTLCTKSS